MGEPVFSAAKVRLYLPCWMRCLPAGPMLLKYSPAFQGSSAKRGPIGRRRCLRCSSTADRRGGLRTFIGSSGRIVSAISRLPSTSKKNACGAESMRQGMEYKAVTTKIGRSVFSIWLVLQGSRKGNPPSFYRILVRTTALLVQPDSPPALAGTPCASGSRRSSPQRPCRSSSRMPCATSWREWIALRVFVTMERMVPMTLLLSSLTNKCTASFVQAWKRLARPVNQRRGYD